ncbi:MFS transporter [Sphingomonas sp. TX0543]|uniref:MFS transporter n=1 Tax=Sphingomonas sp. TX0543 TaxID=3399682 RepID=UPI003AFABB07
MRSSALSRRSVGLPTSWALLVIGLIVVHAYFDRQIVAVLALPIKADLALSDVQLSLLTGLAFGLCVAVAMIPAGILADRYDRVHLLSGGVALWSSMTVYGGFAGDFTHLFISRLGVGLGEAIIVPTTFSLLGELFDDRRRSLAVAIVVSSAPVGLGLASFLGGPLYEWVRRLGSYQVGAIRIEPWQITLILTGAVGLLLGIACLTLHEPRRARRRQRRLGPYSSLPLTPALRAQRALFAPFAAGFALFSVVGLGAIAWAPALLTRSYGWPVGEAGLILGSSMIASGICGAHFAGWLSHRAAKYGKDATMPFMAVACGFVAILFVAMPFARSGIYAAVVLGSIPFFLYGSSTVGTSLLLRIAPAGLRARLSALLALVLAIAGSACGPTVFAFFSDSIFSGKDGLQDSIAFIGSFVLACASILFIVASRALSRDTASIGVQS